MELEMSYVKKKTFHGPEYPAPGLVLGESERSMGDVKLRTFRNDESGIDGKLH
jgi:hypothetical protein